VDFPIPGNDDAIKSVALIVRAVADAIEEGYKEFGKAEKKKKEEQEEIEEKETEEVDNLPESASEEEEDK